MWFDTRLVLVAFLGLSVGPRTWQSGSVAIEKTAAVPATIPLQALEWTEEIISPTSEIQELPFLDEANVPSADNTPIPPVVCCWLGGSCSIGASCPPPSVTVACPCLRG